MIHLQLFEHIQLQLVAFQAANKSVNQGLAPLKKIKKIGP